MKFIQYVKNLFKSKPAEWEESEFVGVFNMTNGNLASNASVYKQKHISSGKYTYFAKSQWGTYFIDGIAYEKTGKIVFL